MASNTKYYKLNAICDIAEPSVVSCYRVAALAAVDRVVALQPGEVAASVDVQEVGLRGFTNVQRSIEVAAEVQKRRVKYTEKTSRLRRP